ncbi:MraY family glycosyltransferase [Gilvimarinus japonicus]|uniref:Glycosyltransferase family 4 protein n=1 Tax=Gilvimarinus japonicus TaxID=1796469 RepID=A0ABV7HMC8_9GAMM
MSLTEVVAGLLASFILTALLTGLIRFYALRRGLLDAPGARSSHSVPTPRGGGLAVAIVALGWILLHWLSDVGVSDLSGASNLVVVYVVAALVAAVGFWDDHGHVLSGVRLFVHLLAGVILVALLPRFQITFLNLDIGSGTFGFIVLTLVVAWYINLFNFMDGIDGIAAFEAMFVFGGYAWLAYWFGAPQLVSSALCVLASVAGFALWNFPRARIFMGDVGSGFLGTLIMGFLFVLSGIEKNLFWAGLLLSGVFIVDATLTLLHRLCRGEALYKAHRTHAYQYAARRYHSHALVTLALMAINLLWLLPMAWVAATGLLSGWVVLLIGYAPLVLLAAVFHAGRAERA